MLAFSLSKSMRNTFVMRNFSKVIRNKSRPLSRGIQKIDAPLPLDQCWKQVHDKQSGLSYWWNTQSNETTALGAPKPLGPSAVVQYEQTQSSPGVMSGIGGVVAQGEILIFIFCCIIYVFYD